MNCLSIYGVARGAVSLFGIYSICIGNVNVSGMGILVLVLCITINNKVINKLILWKFNSILASNVI